MPLSTPAEAPLRATSTAPAADQADSTTPTYSLPDLVCFAHLHWDFVWQRPQHLLSRFAQHGRVFYVEDAFFHADDLIEPHMEVKERQNGVKVLVVHLPNRLRGNEAASDQAQVEVLKQFFADNGVDTYVFWVYTPMAMNRVQQFQPVLT
ncbi:MAG: glycosyltransferase family 1 protein, partial [Hymenobacter sp.]